MPDTREFDDLVSKYSDELMKMKEKWSKWGIVTQEPDPPAVQAAAATQQPEESDTQATNNSIQPPLFQESTDENTQELTPAVEEEVIEDTPPLSDTDTVDLTEDTPTDTNVPISDLPKANPENYATFFARVFSGDEAYPVPNAKVLVYLDNNLHIFLTTDENGETTTVKLESYPAENAFIPDSDRQYLDYSADVHAIGFTTRKNLLVSAVGGSKILLSVQLTPESERID